MEDSTDDLWFVEEDTISVQYESDTYEVEYEVDDVNDDDDVESDSDNISSDAAAKVSQQFCSGIFFISNTVLISSQFKSTYNAFLSISISAHNTCPCICR